MAIVFGAVVLALAGGAIALTTRGGGQITREVVTRTVSSPAHAVPRVAHAKPSRPVRPAKKPRRRAQPTPVSPCRGVGGEDSDPTGDDRPRARHATGVCRSA